MNIQLLLTGHELMAGHIIDTNSVMIAQQFSEAGLFIDRKLTIGDKLESLIKEIRAMGAEADLLLINGGLGPTSDDLTAEALSAATGLPLEEHPLAMAHLNRWCSERQLELTAANRKQALLPAGVNIVANPVGTAVGFSCHFNNCLIVCTPGVPDELEQMLGSSIAALLRKHFPIRPNADCIRLQTYGIGESSLQELINAAIPNWPASVELGFRAQLPEVEVKLSIRSSADKAEQTHCLQLLKTVIGDYIFAENDSSLAATVVSRLTQQKKTLTIAESCTGGQIAARITGVAGASKVFEAGFVSYSDRIKRQLLGVSEQSLRSHGAVSREVAIQMAAGALRSADAELVIAVTGIAGPDGGSEQKPVGIVWIAWGDYQEIHSECLRFQGERHRIQQQVTACCLDLIRRKLDAITATPRYIEQRRWPGEIN